MFPIPGVTTGGPTFPLSPIILAPVPRTGPLGDGSPLTANDTLLTFNWIDKLASTMNLTNSENQAYETLLGEDLIQILADAMEDSDVEIIDVKKEVNETLQAEDLIHILEDAMEDSDVEIIDVGDPAGKTCLKNQ